MIEQHGLSYRPGGKREYHAITRGWIVNELFRRVDPAGRTIGEFLRQEISGHWVRMSSWAYRNRSGSACSR